MARRYALGVCSSVVSRPRFLRSQAGTQDLFQLAIKREEFIRFDTAGRCLFMIGSASGDSSTAESVGAEAGRMNKRPREAARRPRTAMAMRS